MLRRILGVLLVLSAVTLATMRPVYAGTDNGNGNGGQNNGNQNGKNKDPSAPELNPSCLGEGVLLLAGSVFLLNESRRRRN
jgi:hypothetical protein